MSRPLNYDQLCPQCLRNFAGELPWARKSHCRRCDLPYSHSVCKVGNLTVFGVSQFDSAREKNFAARSIVRTISDSGEILADNAGWYPNFPKAECDKYHPYLFIAVIDGKTAGAAVVVRDDACRYDFTKAATQKKQKSKMSQRWCVSRIWIARPHRGQGIGKQLTKAIAHAFKISQKNLAWKLPFTEAGENLAISVSGRKLYVSI
jgi:GNAT superfamily N-acetyltransferase